MIRILTVIYQSNISTSETLMSLVQHQQSLEDTQLICWDNSPTPLPNSEIKIIEKLGNKSLYFHSATNESLSSIYNHIAVTYLEQQDHLVFFDDDTTIPLAYFRSLEHAIKQHTGVNLFLPTVSANNQIVSPAFDYIIKSKRLATQLAPGVMSSRNLTAINSGMAISATVFKNGFRYDESLKFYGTDNYFMNRYRKRYRDLVILDVVLTHQLTFEDTDELEKKIAVFKEVKRASLIINSGNFAHYTLALLNNIIVSIKLVIKYRSFKFLL